MAIKGTIASKHIRIRFAIFYHLVSDISCPCYCRLV